MLMRANGMTLGPTTMAAKPGASGIMAETAGMAVTGVTTTPAIERRLWDHGRNMDKTFYLIAFKAGSFFRTQALIPLKET